MAHWNLTVNLGDLVKRYKADEVDIPELARLVVERIKATDWRKITPYPETFDGLLNDLLTSLNKHSYASNFEEIYDLADSDRVWIETS
jgi:hypothetical protein